MIVYTRPEGQTLTTFGTWHIKSDDKISYQYKSTDTECKIVRKIFMYRKA
ncbi:MAG: hypothetical protein IPN13_22190 [Bacteroidetes bacterium]|nr:hypothetical protein [Bacteroidota bacterium]